MRRHILSKGMIIVFAAICLTITAGVSERVYAQTAIEDSAEFEMSANIEIVSGDTLFGDAGDTLGPMTIKVTDNNGDVIVDSSGNPIPIPVIFEIVSFPEGAVGQTLVPGDSTAEVYTDDLGMASVNLVLGDSLGLYAVAATSAFSTGFLMFSAFTAGVAYNIEVTATSPHVADGVDSSTVVATVTDFLGDPVIGTDIVLVNVIGIDYAEAFSTTDNGDGTYTGFVTTTYAGTTHVYAIDTRTQTSGETTAAFEAGSVAEVRLSVTKKPRDAEPKDAVIIEAFAVDTLGNVVMPPAANIVFDTDLGMVDSVTVEDGFFTAKVISLQLGIATVTATESGSGISDTTEVIFPAIYCGFPEGSVFLESEFTVPVNIFVPPPYGPLGYYDLQITFDPTKASFVGVSDGDTTDELDTPNVEVISDSMIRIYQEHIFIPDTLLYEGFEGAVFPPAGWKALNMGDDSTGNTVHRDSLWSKTARYSASIVHGDSLIEGFQDEWLITPALDFSDTNIRKLQFNHETFYWERDNAPNQVLISTTTPDASVFTDTVYSVVHPDPDPDGEKVTIDLSEYSGQSTVYIAFRYQSTWGEDYFIDDVTVVSVPKCLVESIDIAEVVFDCQDTGSTHISLDLWQGSPYSLVDIMGDPVPNAPKEDVDSLKQKKPKKLQLKFYWVEGTFDKDKKKDEKAAKNQIEKEVKRVQEIFEKNKKRCCAIKVAAPEINKITKKEWEEIDKQVKKDNKLDSFTSNDTNKDGKTTEDDIPADKTKDGFDKSKEMEKLLEKKKECHVSVYIVPGITYWKKVWDKGAKDWKKVPHSAAGATISPNDFPSNWKKKRAGIVKTKTDGDVLVHELGHLLIDWPRDKNKGNEHSSKTRDKHVMYPRLPIGEEFTKGECDRIMRCTNPFLKKDP